jgi:hypothetical protein
MSLTFLPGLSQRVEHVAVLALWQSLGFYGLP